MKTKKINKIVTSKWIVYILLSLQILPLHYFFGLPLPKILPGFLASIYILYKVCKNWLRTKKITIKKSSSPIVVIQALMLISAILFAMKVGSLSETYLRTSFVLTLQAIFPISFYYLPSLIDKREIRLSLNFTSMLYLIFGVATSLMLYQLAGMYFDDVQLRDAPLILNKYVGEGENSNGGFNIIGLFIYYGRTNTIAPAISLAVVPIVASIYGSKRAPTVKNLIGIVIVGLTMIILMSMNSRAAILALIITSAAMIAYRFITTRKMAPKITIIFIATSILITIAITGITDRFTLQSYLKDGRYEILEGVVNSGKLISLFGQGLASAPYQCAMTPMGYFETYSTNFCTFHNAFLTALHDIGIIGFIVIVYIVVRPLFGLIHSYTHKYERTSKLYHEEKDGIDSLSALGLALTTSSMTLMFFDSDILFVQPLFSSIFWYYLGSYNSIRTRK